MTEYGYTAILLVAAVVAYFAMMGKG